MERIADYLRLLIDFLEHEMRKPALTGRRSGYCGLLDRALNTCATLIPHLGAGAIDHCPITLFKIGDVLGHRSERQSIGAQEHFTVTVADGQR